MLSKLGILVSLAFVGNAAMAAYAIDCGKKTDPEEGKVEGSIFTLSTEGETWTGKPSHEARGWSMEYQGVKFPPHKNASIKAVKDKGTEHIKAIVVTVTTGKSASGPVGENLVIANPYSDEPKLIIYAMGGVAGGTKIGSFKCISFID